MPSNKFYDKEILAAIERDILDKLQLSGEVVNGAAKKNAPVKTGALRDSIGFEVDAQEKSVRIGTNIFYAPWIELGTKEIKPRWFLTRALGENAGKIKKIFAKKARIK